MGENSNIEWTTHTFNPWLGCQKVSPGCDNCYAEGWAERFGTVQWGPHAERKRTSAKYWKEPLKWAKRVTPGDERPRVFCASLADVFDNKVPAQWRADLFKLIEDTPGLDWLLLTKRPENIRDMLDETNRSGLPLNVWLGTTCEDQERYNHRWPVLASIAANVHFISYEPALGPLDLTATRETTPLLPDWIICGGESGPKRRPFEEQWARQLRLQCALFSIPFFMKQIDKVREIPPDLLQREIPRSQWP